ncbi:MAG: DNA topoisomerase IB [Caldilinea sp. CFX5]|nr:DNA topoisomerase IB [Caldilinea sp. CFX5]
MSQSATTVDQEAVVCRPDPLVENAGLVYVSDSEPGFQRRRCGRGFTYLDATGQVVRDPALRERFNTLAIPLAWQEVWIGANPDGHLLATGRDEAGRKQYIYHPRWSAMRSQVKYDRLRLFAEALPKMRAQVQADLRKRTLTRAKVTALVVNLLEETMIRIGNEAYARQNETYGLTTLQDDHVEVGDGEVAFEFRGKSGKEHEIVVTDPRLARLVQACQELPGQQLFQYIDEDGDVCGLTSTDVNDYLRTVTGCDFTAKDFRTWGGTVTAAHLLHAIGPGATAKEAEHNVVQVIKDVAAKLGNTPAVCRQHYIHPTIIAAYTAGRLATFYADSAAQPQPTSDLAEDEAVVYTLLSQQVDEG